jgi:hypothetical protein
VPILVNGNHHLEFRVVPDAEGPETKMVSEKVVNVCSGPPSAIILKSSSTADVRHCRGVLGKNCEAGKQLIDARGQSARHNIDHVTTCKYCTIKRHFPPGG